MNQEFINHIVAQITNLFELTARTEGVGIKSRHVSNVFGARVKSSRGVAEIDVIFDNSGATICVEGMLVSSIAPLNFVCETKENFDETFFEIENFVKKCFTPKLKKKI